MPYTALGAERARGIDFALRNRWAAPRNREHVVAEHFVRNCQKERRVDAPRERDGHAPACPQIIPQFRKLILQH